MKSYTDLEQSKKLAEILPLESADACWTNHMFGSLLSSLRIESAQPQEYKSLLDRFVVKGYLIEPAWSLAALLGVLPKTFNYNNHTYQFMYNTHAMFYINVDNYDEDTFCSTNKNLVDACVDMIIKFNELNLL